MRLGGHLSGLSLRRQVLVLAMWPLLEQILAFFVGLTDLLISGRMAEGAERVAILDAMGLGGYVGWFFNILQGAVATGVMALVSRATGGRDGALFYAECPERLAFGETGQPGVVEFRTFEIEFAQLRQRGDLGESRFFPPGRTEGERLKILEAAKFRQSSACEVLHAVQV